MILGKVHPEPEYEARKWRNYDTWSIETPPWVIESFQAKTITGIIFILFLVFMIYLITQRWKSAELASRITKMGKDASRFTSKLTSGSFNI